LSINIIDSFYYQTTTTTMALLLGLFLVLLTCDSFFSFSKLGSKNVGGVMPKCTKESKCLPADYRDAPNARSVRIGHRMPDHYICPDTQNSTSTCSISNGLTVVGDPDVKGDISLNNIYAEGDILKETFS
jgi:hypothetical protein